MAEYSFTMSATIGKAAQLLVEQVGLDEVEAQRTVLYLSCLSAELTLKTLLESAGMPLGEIKKLSHNLSLLQDEVGRCEVKVEAGGRPSWRPGTRVKALVVTTAQLSTTLGELLTLEARGASQYPNEIRYGEHVSHAPANVMLNGAQVLLQWARDDVLAIRRK